MIKHKHMPVHARVSVCVCWWTQPVTSAFSILLRSEKWQQDFRTLQPVRPSSYRNWLLTDTLQAGLQPKEPPGPLACCPWAAAVATAMRLERMCPVVMVEEFFLFQRCGRVLWCCSMASGVGHDQKHPRFFSLDALWHTHTHTDTLAACCSFWQFSFLYDFLFLVFKISLIMSWVKWEVQH